MTEHRRLTDDELLVLRLVQEIHGAHNTVAEVFFTEPTNAGRVGVPFVANLRLAIRTIGFHKSFAAR